MMTHTTIHINYKLQLLKLHFMLMSCCMNQVTDPFVVTHLYYMHVNMDMARHAYPNQGFSPFGTCTAAVQQYITLESHILPITP